MQLLFGHQDCGHQNKIKYMAVYLKCSSVRGRPPSVIIAFAGDEIFIAFGWQIRMTHSCKHFNPALIMADLEIYQSNRSTLFLQYVVSMACHWFQPKYNLNLRNCKSSFHISPPYFLLFNADNSHMIFSIVSINIELLSTYCLPPPKVVSDYSNQKMMDCTHNSHTIMANINFCFS